MRFAPQRRALFRHLNFQKWSDVGALSTFWLGNVLHATTASTFRHRNFQKWSETVSFSHFWLGNLLCATTGCTFSTSQLRKNTVNRDFPTFSRTCLFPLTLSLLWSSHFFSSPLWLFPPLLFHLSILSEVWLLNFLRSLYMHQIKLQNAQCWQSRTMHKSGAYVLHVCAQVVSTFDLVLSVDLNKLWRIDEETCSKMLQSQRISHQAVPSPRRLGTCITAGGSCTVSNASISGCSCSAPSKITPPASHLYEVMRSRSRRTIDNVHFLEIWDQKKRYRALMSTLCSIKRNISLVTDIVLWYYCA